MTFEESFHKCNTQRKPSAKWETLERAYDENTRYIHNIADSLQTNRIPKILHQIWLGSPFPDKYKILTNHWQEMHPDWTIMLWDEKKIEEFGLANKWMYDNMRNPSAKSDVVRYEVAYSYGGVYVDTDFYCCKNIDHLRYLNFFCGMVGSYDGRQIDVENCLVPGIFGCSQGNKLVEQIILRIGEQKTIPKSIEEIMNITGPGMFSEMVISNLEKHPFSVAFPPNYFYPFPAQKRLTIRNMTFDDTLSVISKYKYPETYATHLWHCSWQQSQLL